MDLSPMWIKDSLEIARDDLLRAGVAYSALKDKRTKYAEGILRLIEARRKVVQVWNEA